MEFHQKLLEIIQQHPELSKPGTPFDCFTIETILKTGAEWPEPYPIACALPVLVAQGKLMQVGRGQLYYGCRNPVVRLVMPHENVREQELRRLAHQIANPPPTQGRLF